MDILKAIVVTIGLAAMFIATMYLSYVLVILFVLGLLFIASYTVISDDDESSPPSFKSPY